MNSNYKNFLIRLENRINTKKFKDDLQKVQKIDLNHYNKIISIEELNQIIDEYKEVDVIENDMKNMQVILPGNPEIVFRIGIETIRNNVNSLIAIEDFCLAQNTLLIQVINELYEKIELKNLLSDEEIIKNAKYYNKTLIIGNSNIYNRLEEKIENIIFYPYNIIDMYSDSEDFEELKELIYNYSIQNQFEIEIYDDLEFDEVIEAINRDGYHFCSIMFSKDKEKVERFKKEIFSKYVFTNENPFKKIKFNLKLEN